MRKFIPLCLFGMILSFTGCGGGHSYRNLNTLDNQENKQITQIRHDYAKCILQNSFKLDDGIIDPLLLVKTGERACKNTIDELQFFLDKANFSPAQTSDYVKNVKTDEARKTLEAILRIRTN